MYNGATADTDLHTPINGNNGQYYGISHISFCWTETPTQPTLSITKAASSNQVTAGAAFTYTITVKNTGDVQATGVVITDDLANSLTGVSAGFDVDPDTAGGTGSCTVGAGNTISCAVGTLAANDGSANGPDEVVVTIQRHGPHHLWRAVQHRDGGLGPDRAADQYPCDDCECHRMRWWWWRRRAVTCRDPGGEGRPDRGARGRHDHLTRSP